MSQMHALRTVAIGGFNDLWLFGDSDYRSRQHRRDLGADVVASYPCPECGARAGVPCQRPTVAGHSVARGIPHFERGSAANLGARVKLSDLERANLRREYRLARRRGGYGKQTIRRALEGVAQ